MCFMGVDMLRPYSAPSYTKQGFSLIVVLFSLTILTLLLATASSRSLASLQFAKGEEQLNRRLSETVSALEAVMRANTTPEERVFFWQGRDLRLQPTGGLVDLNTASPELLERLLEGYGITPQKRDLALQAHQRWQEQDRQFLRVSDFARVTGFDLELLPNLTGLATVHSGQPTFSVEQAPLALLEHLTGRRGARETLTAELPEDFLGQPLGSAIAVFEGSRRVGVLRLGTEPTQRGILALN